MGDWGQLESPTFLLDTDADCYPDEHRLFDDNFHIKQWQRWYNANCFTIKTPTLIVTLMSIVCLMWKLSRIQRQYNTIEETYANEHRLLEVKINSDTTQYNTMMTPALIVNPDRVICFYVQIITNTMIITQNTITKLPNSYLCVLCTCYAISRRCAGGLLGWVVGTDCH